jgi:hypothetical protein
MILGLNSLLDTGKYDYITVEQAREAIRDGSVLQFLKREAGSDIDLSVYLHSGSKHEFERWYAAKLQDLLGGYNGREAKKWGVENRGLCLLIAWTNEIIQSGDELEWDPKRATAA